MAPAAVGIGAAASKMRGPRPSCAPGRPPAPGRARSFSISSIGVARLRLESRPAKWNPYPSAPMMPPLTKMGMSGSPIFVNGGIIGALGYGFHFAGRDSNLSLATPIEEMLKLLARPGAGGRPGAQEG